MPQEYKVKSDRVRCFSGSNLALLGENKFDLRKKPKNANNAAAQNMLSSKLLKLSSGLILSNRSGVIGTFRLTESPLCLLMPDIKLDNIQLSLRGLGNPPSMCKIRTMFKYFFIEDTCNLRARYTVYLHRLVVVNGVGDSPS